MTSTLPARIRVSPLQCTHGPWEETAYCEWHLDDGERNCMWCAIGGEDSPVSIREVQAA